MNILFFLTPKSEVAYIFDDENIKNALEKMENYRYTAVPIIDHQGHYVGTITEGDLLFFIKNKYHFNFESPENICICKVPRRSDNKPVRIDANIENLVDTAMNQNFIPVMDDTDSFIGIVTRKDIIQYCYKQYKKMVSGV